MTFRQFLEALLSASFEPPRDPPPAQAPSARPPEPAGTPGLLPYVPGTIVYYSLDGTAAFRFKFEQQPGGGIRVYILEQPPYAGRNEGTYPTHRLADGALRFICFVPLPRTTNDARALARAWAELTLRYIRTGQQF